MNNDFETDFNLGGSIERAISGQYELKAGKILHEAWQLTIKQFFSFSPAVIILLIVQFGIFYIALKLQLSDLSGILDMMRNPETITPKLIKAIYVANCSYEVISAPIFAGISLMAMSHAAGVATRITHLSKGLQYTISVMIATFLSLVLQGLGGIAFPLISIYLSIAFSLSILLIGEKRVSPLKSLWLSLRAVNRKILVITGLYLCILIMFIVAAMFYGIGLIFVLPFFYHLKGILYREMFGIKLKIMSKPQSDNHKNNHDNGVFNA